jgi:spore germination protein KC
MGPKKRFILSVICIGLLCCGSGCWDVDEIDDRAIVLALGLDLTPEGEILTSIQLPNIIDLTNYFTEGGKAPEKPYRVRVSRGKTVFGAIPGLQSKTSSNLFLGQIQAIIISAELAMQGLKPLLDFMDRHPEIPLQTFILIVDGSAKEILDSQLSSKEIPGISIHNFLESSSKADMVYSLRVHEIKKRMLIGPEAAYLPIIAYDDREKTYIINGLAVFHKDRMVGRLNPIETRMLGFLVGKARNAYPSVTLANGAIATFRDVKCRTKYQVSTAGARIRFKVKARAQGFLVELTSNQGEFLPEEIKQITKKTEQEITIGMLKTINRLQELNSDLLGLGELLRATKPEIWKGLNWEERFPEVEVEVDFRFKIQRLGTYR